MPFSPLVGCSRYVGSSTDPIPPPAYAEVELSRCLDLIWLVGLVDLVAIFGMGDLADSMKLICLIGLSDEIDLKLLADLADTVDLIDLVVLIGIVDLIRDGSRPIDGVAFPMQFNTINANSGKWRQLEVDTSRALSSYSGNLRRFKKCAGNLRPFRPI